MRITWRFCLKHPNQPPHQQILGSEYHFLLAKSQTWLIKSFGKKISPLKICVDLHEIDQLLFVAITNEVITNLDVFRFRVLNRVFGYRYGNKVINMNRSGKKLQTVVSHLLLNPENLWAATRSNNVFCFTRWLRNCSLLFALPRH